ncbi:MAG: PIN domain-containing protein [Chloroflexi bacterium]|nr:PIN domain-containing protein [Chloroflexota bacterium]
MAERRGELRVLLDANILIAGSVWPRWPYEVLQHAANGDFRVLLTPYIIAQAYATLAKKFPNAKPYLDDFFSLPNIEFLKNPTKSQLAKWHDLVRDKTDVPVALAAILAKADYLVSEDKDLTTQDASTVKLREKVAVMVAGTFLREIMGWKSEDLESVRRRNWSDLSFDEGD